MAYIATLQALLHLELDILEWRIIDQMNLFRRRCKYQTGAQVMSWTKGAKMQVCKCENLKING